MAWQDRRQAAALNVHAIAILSLACFVLTSPSIASEGRLEIASAEQQPIPEPGLRAKLHVLLLVDVNDREVGQDLSNSQVYSLVRNSIEALIPRDNCQFEDQPRTFDQNGILSSLRNISLGENDSVLFYYVGRGGYDDPRIGTYLMPSGGSERRDKLSALGILYEINTMKIRPRSAVIFFDCCNRIGGAPRGSWRDQPKAARSPEVIKPLAKTLFFDFTGSAVVVSSSPNEFALVAPVDKDPSIFEPIFTKAFVTAMQDNRDQDIIWPVFIGKTQDNLDLFYRRALLGRRNLTVFDGRTVNQPRQGITLRFYR